MKRNTAGTGSGDTFYILRCGNDNPTLDIFCIYRRSEW